MTGMGKKSGQARAPNRRYVQFSKVIIVAVTAAVTVICIGGMALCFALHDTEAVVELGRAYISYAIVAFTAYSGNSAVEKWLVRKYSGTLETDQDDSNADKPACG